eukprot:TRINITY_DN5003_c0_g1_i2.p1 TRINITY_DN5003_c0_g1~~TRINITY_DN5003_c0_g1_i2.p1  ORF type:complete len:665 (-),score=174.53 TRINITY_DN5003_c0_g1_i2:88-2082(-)
MMNKNSIAVAPTGSGKTIVAILLCLAEKERLKERFKAVFVVDKLHLTIQQSGLFALFTNLNLMIISSEQNSNSKWEDTKDVDVLFIIHDKYLRMILEEEKKKIFISEEISHLILDECHHSHSNHPYSNILKEVLSREKRPIISGFTASPVGKDTKEETEKALTELQQRMGEAEIVQIVENIESLGQHVPTPKVDDVPIPLSKQHQEAVEKIENIMLELEEKIGYKPTHIRGSSKYSKKLKKWSEKKEHVEDTDKLIDISDKLRVFLETGVIKMKPEDFFFQDFSQLDSDVKLSELSALLKTYLEKEGEDFRAIVFVTTKDSVRNIHDFLVAFGPRFHSKDNHGYGYVMGRSEGGKDGMTRPKQTESIEDFKCGKTKILISTSVVEEGFDVPDCNAVFYMGDITSSRSLIQGRGRARKEGSIFHVLYFTGTKGQEFYEKSKKQERNMKEVLKSKEKDGSCPLVNKSNPTSPQSPVISTPLPQSSPSKIESPTSPSTKNPISELREMCQKSKDPADEYRVDDSAFTTEKIVKVRAMRRESQAKSSKKKDAETIAANAILNNIKLGTPLTSNDPIATEPTRNQCTLLQPNENSKGYQVLLREMTQRFPQRPEFAYKLEEAEMIEGEWKVELKAMGRVSSASGRTKTSAEVSAAKIIWDQIELEEKMK